MTHDCSAWLRLPGDDERPGDYGVCQRCGAVVPLGGAA